MADLRSSKSAITDKPRSGLPAIPNPEPTGLDALVSSYARPENQVLIIRPTDDLAAIAGMILQEEVIGLDTETAFFDKGDKNDRGKLALIQVYLPSQRLSVLVDPIESSDPRKREIIHRDLQPLKMALEDPSIIKVAHSAAFDRDVLEGVGINVEALHDTQSMLRSIRSDIRQYSLRVACKYVLGLEIDKEQQASSWHERPLSNDQITYAALDPELAYKLYSTLNDIRNRTQSFSDLSFRQAIELLDSKMKALDELIDLNMPELLSMEAKEHALLEELRRRFPVGSSEHKSSHGSIYPGKNQQELDYAKLVRELRSIPMNDYQSASLEKELVSITSYETSKTKIAAALKECGPANFGFSTLKQINEYLTTFQVPSSPSSPNIFTSYQLKQEAYPVIGQQIDTEVLMADLSDTTTRILLGLRDIAPEIPALRTKSKRYILS